MQPLSRTYNTTQTIIPPGHGTALYFLHKKFCNSLKFLKADWLGLTALLTQFRSYRAFR